MAIQIKFGTYDFSSLIGEIKTNSGTRIQQYVIPRNDGAKIHEGLLQPIKVTMEGDILAATFTALRTALDDFLKEIGKGKKNLYLYDDRYVEAQKQSFGYRYLRAMTMIRFSLTFIGGKPFWVAISASQDIEVVASSPHTYLISTGGSAYVKPVITITADQGSALSSISFENETANEVCGFAGTVALNKSLVIDTDAMTVENDGVDALGDFSGDFLRLLAGPNSMKYTGQNCTITIDWYDRWF